MTHEESPKKKQPPSMTMKNHNFQGEPLGSDSFSSANFMGKNFSLEDVWHGVYSTVPGS
jgi:hypothetical protein